MVIQSYTECFWGENLKSTYGCDALIKRNNEGKKMCTELEDYLKKRSKLESDFSKSLGNLAKCFKYREEVGDLERALNQFRYELDSMAKSHHGASVFFSNQLDVIKAFRDDQSSKAKQMEDNLVKSQTAKLNQLNRTIQLEKTYKKKCFDRDAAENTMKEIERDCPTPKDLEKAKSRYVKAEEDAQKADNNYRTGVIVLEDNTKDWEKTMEMACQIVQELDEKRVRFLRQELWVTVNVDSKLSLDVDNCCEGVRQKLETCDVLKDMDAFLKSASTGTVRPKRYSFKPYSSHSQDVESDPESSGSNDNNNDEDVGNRKNGTLTMRRNSPKTKNVFAKFKNQMKQ